MEDSSLIKIKSRSGVVQFKKELANLSDYV